VDFREALLAELRQRHLRNARYSLRAFARDLGSDHATLSQLLRGRHHFSPRTIARRGRRLGLSGAFLGEALLHESAQAILRLLRRPSFRPNSRWIPTRTGIPLDRVNAANQLARKSGENPT
jgi:transcriptional regulator with XRE-family HTH domain